MRLIPLVLEILLRIKGEISCARVYVFGLLNDFLFVHRGTFNSVPLRELSPAVLDAIVNETTVSSIFTLAPGSL